MPISNKIYTVHAYRLGDRERHSYIVGVYMDKELSLKASIDEEYWRGGKYVCEVCEWRLGYIGEDSPLMPRIVIKPLPKIPINKRPNKYTN